MDEIKSCGHSAPIGRPYLADDHTSQRKEIAMLRYVCTAALVAALATAPGFALAQNQGQTTPTQPEAAQAAETVGLARAVEAAEAALPGRGLEAEMESEGGRLVYEVELIRDGGLYQVVVDANTGEVISTDEQVITGTWRSWFNSDRLNAIQAAPQSLAEILANVESDTGGRVQEADLDEEDGRVFYEIELTRADGTQAEVFVDANTGDILPGEID